MKHYNFVRDEEMQFHWESIKWTFWFAMFGLVSMVCTIFGYLVAMMVLAK